MQMTATCLPFNKFVSGYMFSLAQHILHLAQESSQRHRDAHILGKSQRAPGWGRCGKNLVNTQGNRQIRLLGDRQGLFAVILNMSFSTELSLIARYKETVLSLVEEKHNSYLSFLRNLFLHALCVPAISISKSIFLLLEISTSPPPF